MIDRRKQTCDAYLSVSEQGAHGEPAREETLSFSLPPDDVEFVRLGLLLDILEGVVFVVVGL
jgi:hypothetical protein